MPWHVAPRRERPHMRRLDQWLGYGVHGMLFPLWVKLVFQPLLTQCIGPGAMAMSSAMRRPESLGCQGPGSPSPRPDIIVEVRRAGHPSP